MKSYPLILLISLLLNACVDTDPRPLVLDGNFGHSVKKTLHAQLLDPRTATHSSQRVSTTMDGQVGQNIMNTYRNSFATVQKVQPVTTISVGTSALSQ